MRDCTVSDPRRVLMARNVIRYARRIGERTAAAAGCGGSAAPSRRPTTAVSMSDSNRRRGIEPDHEQGEGAHAHFFYEPMASSSRLDGDVGATAARIGSATTGKSSTRDHASCRPEHALTDRRPRPESPPIPAKASLDGLGPFAFVHFRDGLHHVLIHLDRLVGTARLREEAVASAVASSPSCT